MSTKQSDKIYLRLLLESLRIFGMGDFSVRMPLDLDGIRGEIADAFNRAVGLAAAMDAKLGQDSEKDEFEPVSKDTRSVLAGKHVLIVDDDVRTLFAVTEILEREHIRVLRAEDGNEGLRLLEERPDVDLVLMDIMMPGLDGFEAIRRIRQKPEHASLPVIALTAKTMEGAKESCIRAGASAYVSKPVDNDQLISIIQEKLIRVKG